MFTIRGGERGAADCSGGAYADRTWSGVAPCRCMKSQGGYDGARGGREAGCSLPVLHVRVGLSVSEPHG